MNTLSVATVSAALLLCLLGPATALACSCVLNNNPTEFRGCVIDVEEIMSSDGGWIEQQIYTFEIERDQGIFQTGDRVDVTTGGGGGDCGASFRVGETYRVDLGSPPTDVNNLSTDSCSNNQRLRDASGDPVPCGSAGCAMTHSQNSPRGAATALLLILPLLASRRR